MKELLVCNYKDSAATEKIGFTCIVLASYAWEVAHRQKNILQTLKRLLREVKGHWNAVICADTKQQLRYAAASTRVWNMKVF